MAPSNSPNGATWRINGAIWRQNVANAHYRQISPFLAPNGAIWRQIWRHVAPRGATCRQWRSPFAKYWRLLAVSPRGDGTKSEKKHAQIVIARWRHLTPLSDQEIKSPNGAVWRHMATFGAKWRYLAPNGELTFTASWRHMAKLGAKWRRLAPNGAIWRLDLLIT